MCLGVLPGHLLEALRKTTGDGHQQMRICDLLPASQNHLLLLQIFRRMSTVETEYNLLVDGTVAFRPYMAVASP